MSTFKELGERIGNLLEEKNAAYGNSFDDAGEFLRLLYPTGVQPNQMNDALCLVRIFDKMKRIATNKDAFGESPYQDIAGYAILGLRRSEVEKKSNLEEPVSQPVISLQASSPMSSVVKIQTSGSIIVDRYWGDNDKQEGVFVSPTVLTPTVIPLERSPSLVPEIICTTPVAEKHTTTLRGNNVIEKRKSSKA